LCGSSDSVRERFALDSLRIVRCRCCALTFRHDSEADADQTHLYSEEYYKSRGAYYLQDEAADGHGNLAEFSEALDGFRRFLPDGGRLLDVGCGIGVFLAAARAEGWDVAGIDLSEFAAGHARERFALEVQSGTLGDRSFAADSFDLVTMWDMIEHVPDPVTELREAHRVLRPDGYLFLNTPNEASLMKVLAGLCYKGSLGKVRYPAQKLYHVYHLFYFCERNLRELLTLAGFDTIQVRKSPIPIVKARGSRVEKGVVWTLSWLERLFGMEYQLSVVARKA